MFCHECGTKFAQSVKFCPSCGTAQSQNLDSSEDVAKIAPKDVCQACFKSNQNSGARLCRDCTERDVPPKNCQNCGKQSQRAGLPLGKISAYPHQDCEFCGYNYFVPEDLARVLFSRQPEPLSSVTLEWLLFAAWNWASRNGKGIIPIIDVDEEGAKAHLAGNEIPFSTWTEMYWGFDEGLYANDLLPMMNKYSKFPQLWYADEEYFDGGEGGLVSMHCYPRWQTKMDGDQEKAVRESLSMTKALTNQDTLIQDLIGELF